MRDGIAELRHACDTTNEFLSRAEDVANRRRHAESFAYATAQRVESEGRQKASDEKVAALQRVLVESRGRKGALDAAIVAALRVWEGGGVGATILKIPKLVEEEEEINQKVDDTAALLRAAVARLPRAPLEMVVVGALTPREASTLSLLSSRASPCGNTTRHPMAFLTTTFLTGSVALVDAAIAEAFAWPAHSDEDDDGGGTTVPASSPSLTVLRIEVQCLALQIRLLAIAATHCKEPILSSREDAANALRRVRSILSGSGRTWPHVVSTS